ncbi:L-threonylcarbamoyladenylate synthase [Rhodobaculum claviforme]|uniref:Threonylcarbamoyl-AMP synthase n=1 Tax=Rhodobaculum claviforme TaxID=1549854 RepID=A0A934TNK5_9RHOB|nr:L-threonylcarbamoyladenylate synthase [Rhodobaculum claviforme]MBK5928383.1 threonylcarbamoyl-AMP synthase [Rhodobaculum claviforme]
MPTTLCLDPDDAGLDRAAALLSGGGLVAFPTETVYGLGARGDDARAVALIFAAKGRPRFNPLILHVPDLAAAARVAVFDADARRLAAAFWPGPLTLVLPRRADAGVADLACAGLATVAVRVPAHPVARALLARVGVPVAAPSANPSGRISPTTAAHVLEGLSGHIDAVLDAGPCAVGVESTIVALTGGPAVLLRPGGLPAEAVAQVLGAPLAQAATGATPAAPGMLASHYAPDARLRLAPDGPAPDEVWLGFGPDPATAAQAAHRLNLSPGGDLTQAAAGLFALLRRADALAGPGGRIAVRPVPDDGLGRAINDRLVRAAAPR